jgi:hypothetical protein
MRFAEAQLAEYHREGYVVIDSPFAPELTQRCLEAVEAVAIDPATNTGDGKGNHYSLKPQVDGSYWCDLDHSLPFLQIELHPEIVELARQLIGDDDIYFRNGGINELAPGRSFLWHRDSEDDYVEFMHYFSGADPDSGCLRVIGGTHVGATDALVADVARRRRERGDPQTAMGEGFADVELPGEISLSLGPHQLLVRSSRIFHATWLNGSSSGRLMHHWLFREPGADNHRFPFDDYLTSELIEALTPEQRQVLWLGREFELDPKWEAERERERGKVSWGVP